MEQNPQNQVTNQAPSYNHTITEYNLPEKFKPISAWGYVGYELLFAIPCVGLILMLVFAFGGTQNVNLRNFARSYLCFMLIGLILTIILFALGGLSFLYALT